LTEGASEGIEFCISALIKNSNHGLLVPVPQYPLYSALIVKTGGNIVGYYLKEEDDWSISLEDIEKSYQQAIKKGIVPKALVVINPGNPTG